MSLSRICLFVVLVTMAFSSYGHSSSEAYLSLQVQGKAAHGAWEFSLRDLEYSVGLDANGDGRVDWKDIKQRQSVVLDYILSGVNISQGQQACTVTPGQLMLNDRVGGVFLYLPVTVNCLADIDQLQLRYQLFFKQDIRHHAIWSVTAEGVSINRISSIDNSDLLIDMNSTSLYQGFIEFILQGIWHIWIGLDHILFLVLLMLSVENSLASLKQPVHRQRWIRVVKTVTAFTLAHSITLAIAATGWLALPSVWVESIIALSVILAGLNVLFKWVEERLWWFAFVFGLIHGFGFASVLLDLGLNSQQLIQNILAFNIGVEVGQLVIVALAIPVLSLLSRMNKPGRYIKHMTTTGVIMLASVWFVQRLSG